MNAKDIATRAAQMIDQSLQIEQGAEPMPKEMIKRIVWCFEKVAELLLSKDMPVDTIIYDYLLPENGSDELAKVDGMRHSLVQWLKRVELRLWMWPDKKKGLPPKRIEGLPCAVAYGEGYARDTRIMHGHPLVGFLDKAYGEWRKKQGDGEG